MKSQDEIAAEAERWLRDEYVPDAPVSIYVLSHPCMQTTKVGISDEVTVRRMRISRQVFGNRVESPLVVRAQIELPNRSIALQIEGECHDELGEWRLVGDRKVGGEWFNLPWSKTLRIVTNTICFAMMRRWMAEHAGTTTLEGLVGPILRLKTNSDTQFRHVNVRKNWGPTSLRSGINAIPNWCQIK